MANDPKTTPRGTTSPVETRRAEHARDDFGRTPVTPPTRNRSMLWLVLGGVLALLVLFFLLSGDDGATTPGVVGAPVEGVDAPVAGSIDGNAGPATDPVDSDIVTDDAPAAD